MKEISNNLLIVLRKHLCNLRIEIQSRMAYNGATYCDVGAKIKWDQRERIPTAVGSNLRRRKNL